MSLKEDNLSIINFSGYQHIYGQTQISYLYKRTSTNIIQVAPYLWFPREGALVI
jgi:hypothetical protein